MALFALSPTHMYVNQHTTFMQPLKRNQVFFVPVKFVYKNTHVYAMKLGSFEMCSYIILNFILTVHIANFSHVYRKIIFTYQQPTNGYKVMEFLNQSKSLRINLIKMWTCKAKRQKSFRCLHKFSFLFPEILTKAIDIRRMVSIAWKKTSGYMNTISPQIVNYHTFFYANGYSCKQVK